jgi:hypothetical protein
MRSILLVLTLGLSAGGSTPGDGSSPAHPKPPVGPGRDLGAEVHRIFSLKCTQCHGAELSKPEGKFGYVLDLQRLAASPGLVVPFQLDQSRLWTLVRDDEMPPPDARAGPLTAEQKDVIRAWIVAGAPPASSQSGAGPASSAARADFGTAGKHLGAPPVRRLLGWLGKFHVLVVHFPIALLLVAALAEAVAAWRGVRGPQPAVRLCTLLGAGGACAAAALGWLHADFGGHGAAAGPVLSLHRWIGTAVSLGAAGAALLSEWGIRRRRCGPLFRPTLWVSAALVAATGHFGGILTHGDGFLDW